MELNFEEKMDLLICVCACLGDERQRYELIKDLSDQELEDFQKEYNLSVKLDKDKMKNKVERLESLKKKLKEETS